MDAGFVVGKLKVGIRIFLVVEVIFDVDKFSYWRNSFHNQKPPISQKGWFLSGGTHHF